MTPFEILTGLLDTAQIPYTVESYKNPYIRDHETERDYANKTVKTVKVYAHENGTVGFDMFYTMFYFDADDRLITMGAWE